MKSFSQSKNQRGSYLVGIAIGLMVTLFLAAYAIPKFQSMLVEGAIPSVAEQIQRYVANTKVATKGAGTTPYTGLTQAQFARAVKGSSLEVGTVSGQGTGSTVVRHGLGGGDAGLVTLATTGATFSLTFAAVSDYACPGLAQALQRTFDGITINATAVKATDAGGVVTQAYVAGTASARCVDGDNNVFVFTVARN